MSAASHNLSDMPKTSRLVRYTGWNLLGMTLPMVVALVAIPLLVRGLGDERFGVLSIIWVLVGYFSIFDFGLGRALTRMTAKKLGQSREEEVPSVFWTAFIIMVLIGIAGASLVALLSPWLAYERLNINPELQQEVCRSFYLVAGCIPVVISTVGLIGLLEAHQRFGLLNAIRIPLGIFTFVGPLLILPFTRNMVAVVGILMAGRLLVCALYFAAAVRTNPALWRRPQFRRDLVRPLLTFGGWMTVSNLVLPLMLQIDRIFIGDWVSVIAVAFYTAASEVVIRLLILPRSWVSALFPVFASHYKTNPERTRRLFLSGVKCLLMIIFPPVLACMMFADEGFLWWLGADYAEKSAPVMKIMAVAMFFNSLAAVPCSFLQAIGRPRLSAIAHLIELPLFIMAAWILSQRFGICGMAAACLFRAVLDAALMISFARRYLRGLLKDLGRVWAAATAAMPVLWLLQYHGNLVTGIALFFCVTAGWLVFCWRAVLTESERADLPRPWQKYLPLK